MDLCILPVVSLSAKCKIADSVRIRTFLDCRRQKMQFLLPNTGDRAESMIDWTEFFLSVRDFRLLYI